MKGCQKLPHQASYAGEFWLPDQSRQHCALCTSSLRLHHDPLNRSYLPHHTHSGKDLSIDPATRGVKDIKHELVAAASSSSKPKAEAFLRNCLAKPDAARAYGSYSELVADPNVDIVYIASPHSHHYQNAMLCLRAGKHVLCEKAFTVNAAQARKLVEAARERKVLLMEGLWTRYFPVSLYVREQIVSGRLGPVERVLSEHSLAYTKNLFDDGHIMVKPGLARGTLLDSGIYSLTWVFQCLYHTQPASTRQRPTVQSAAAKCSATGVDAMTIMVLDFPRAADQGGHAHAVATTSLGLSINAVAAEQDISIPTVRIQGPKGEIQVFPPHTVRRGRGLC